MSEVTVLILVPNAGDRLPRCLDSVAWANDIFCVVDPKTADGSDAVARRYTGHVVVHEYVNAANQRNWALPQIVTEWTLVLDADEWLSESLIARIQAILADPNAKDGYAIRRQSLFFGALVRYCGWQRDYNVRLFRTRKGRYLEKRVHSKVVVDGAMGRIHEPMYHDTYRDFDEYFRTFQRFSTWSALDMYDHGRRAHATDLTLRPLVKFFKMYVLRQGFRDGFRGLVLCGLSAFHVFMKYAKLWNIARLARETSRGNGNAGPA